jgi:fatty-acyl-CoA synthase
VNELGNCRLTKIVKPTPTDRGIPFRPVDFGSFSEALDYAAEGDTGVNFFSGRGEMVERLPYADLREQSLQLAQKLIVAGMQAGDRVAILAESHGDFLRAFAACQYARLIPVPMPLPAAFRGRAGYIDQLRRMISAAGAAAAFGPKSLQNWLDEATEDMSLRFACTVDDLPALQDDIKLPEITTDGIAYLQFSSGSTRFPMGIAVTHDAFIANTQAIARHGMRIRPEDRCTTWLPFYHDLGLVGCLLTPIVTQMSIDIIPTQDFARRPLSWLSTLGQHGGTLSFGPTFGYELCVRRARTTQPPEDLDLSRWRAAGIGGDMVRPSVLRNFAETFGPYGFEATSFSPSYGMAEATVAISFHEPGTGLAVDTVDLNRLEGPGEVVPASDDTPRIRSFVRCGRVLPDHQLEVRDEDGNALPDLRVGRFFLRGPSVMQGYFGLPEETGAALSSDGWLNTGDLGYLCDGEIVITGRAKDLIIVNGRNIWPQDLEWSVEREVELLQTGDAAAFSVEEDDNERVVLLIQCRATDEATREALRSDVAAVVSSAHGVECSVVLVPHNSLPRTSSGKLSRTRSRLLYLDGTLAEQSPVSAK